MPFESYQDTFRYSKLIATVTTDKAMPPPFAIPEVGHVVNDPSLTLEQITVLKAWADAKAPAGNPDDAPHIDSDSASSGWKIGHPSLVIKSDASHVPAQNGTRYVTEIVPTHFSVGRWVQAVEVRPASPWKLRRAVIYIRPRDSKWLSSAQISKPFDAGSIAGNSTDGKSWNNTDILLVYAPGSSPAKWPTGTAKFIPKRADLIFELEYNADATASSDTGTEQTSIGLVLADKPPTQRIITLGLTNHAFVIPPNAAEYRVEASAVLPKDATLLSCFPMMHQRGKRFEYDIVRKNQDASATSPAGIETLLRVNYDTRWRMSYPFVEPRFLPAGTRLQAVAWYDNSPNNPHNPDPDASVHWGENPSDEIMWGFFDVLIPAKADAASYSLQP